VLPDLIGGKIPFTAPGWADVMVFAPPPLFMGKATGMAR
jgi:hypothetical protein